MKECFLFTNQGIERLEVLPGKRQVHFYFCSAVTAFGSLVTLGKRQPRLTIYSSPCNVPSGGGEVIVEIPYARNSKDLTKGKAKRGKV